MTDTPPLADALPLIVTVTRAFNQRLPSQRFLDLVRRLEPGENFGELATEQPFRLVAFRALLRDFPDRDETSLWLHAYDVEVEVVDDDPFNGKSPSPGPLSVPIGIASPVT